jgi:hypothetical protein
MRAVTGADVGAVRYRCRCRCGQVRYVSQTEGITKALGSLLTKVSSPIAELINLTFADREVMKLQRTPSLFCHVTQNTLVPNYQPTPRNIPEERRNQLRRGGSLKSRKFAVVGNARQWGTESLQECVLTCSYQHCSASNTVSKLAIHMAPISRQSCLRIPEATEHSVTFAI